LKDEYSLEPFGRTVRDTIPVVFGTEWPPALPPLTMRMIHVVSELRSIQEPMGFVQDVSELRISTQPCFCDSENRKLYIPHLCSVGAATVHAEFTDPEIRQDLLVM
jgi:hypothetical protein